MTLNGRSFLFAALGCGLVFIPASGLWAQQTGTPRRSRPEPGATVDAARIRNPTR